MMHLGAERKLIEIFRTFVEKALLPQLRRHDCSTLEWNKFNSLLSADAPNYNQLQAYVDGLSGWTKKFDSENHDTGGFNPSKTFGGEKSKIHMFNNPEPDVPDSKRDSQRDSQRQSQREDSIRQRMNTNNMNIYGNLQKLLKGFEQTQSVLDSLVKDLPTNNNPNTNNNNNTTTTNNNNNLPSRHSRQTSIQYPQPPTSTQSYSYLPQTQSQSQPQLNPQPQSQPQLQYNLYGINHKHYY